MSRDESPLLSGRFETFSAPPARTGWPGLRGKAGRPVPPRYQPPASLRSGTGTQGMCSSVPALWNRPSPTLRAGFDHQQPPVRCKRTRVPMQFAVSARPSVHPCRLTAVEEALRASDTSPLLGPAAKAARKHHIGTASRDDISRWRGRYRGPIGALSYRYTPAHLCCSGKPGHASQARGPSSWMLYRAPPTTSGTQ